MRRYMCGVPTEYCEGSRMESNMSTINKVHIYPTEAFVCYKHYLLRVLGYTQIGSREFSPPDGVSPVLVLTKQSKFGAEFRGGKRGKESAGSTNRLNPKNGRAGYVA